MAGCARLDQDGDLQSGRPHFLSSTSGSFGKGREREVEFQQAAAQPLEPERLRSVVAGGASAVTCRKSAWRPVTVHNHVYCTLLVTPQRGQALSRSSGSVHAGARCEAKSSSVP
jgi:hypothetical protein